MDPLLKPNGTQKRTRSPHKAEYRECMKNHAASMGTHATDGCGEFIPSPSSVASDPTSITCAACGCHRNFHRRIHMPEDDEDESDGDEEENNDEDEAGSHVLLTLKTGGGGDQGRRRKKQKRFRSRFSKEQKEGMMELAERLGWRLQRRDEEVVEEGCRKVGIKRGVFKVWMHNNKQGVLEMKRKSSTSGDINVGNDHNVNDGAKVNGS